MTRLRSEREYHDSPQNADQEADQDLEKTVAKFFSKEGELIFSAIGKLFDQLIDNLCMHTELATISHGVAGSNYQEHE